MRGLGTAGPGFVVRVRCLASSVAWVAAQAAFAGSLARGSQAGSAASSAECLGFVGSFGWRWLGGVGGDDCPAERDEVPSDGGRDDWLAFAALGVQAAPEVVQPLLGLPGDRDHAGWLVFLAALELGA